MSETGDTDEVAVMAVVDDDHYEHEQNQDDVPVPKESESAPEMNEEADNEKDCDENAEIPPENASTSSDNEDIAEKLPEDEKLADNDDTDDSMTTAGIFANEITTMLDHDQLLGIQRRQKDLINLLQQSNRTMKSFNDFSEVQHGFLSDQLKERIRLLRVAKGDLDDIFKRIRAIKGRLHARLAGGDGVAVTVNGKTPM